MRWRKGGDLKREFQKEIKEKSDKTVPDCLHVCRVFWATPPFLQYNWTKTYNTPLKKKTDTKKKTKRQ